MFAPIFLLAVFFAVIIGVLHVTKRSHDLSTFSHYTVGERSFKSWFVAMAYTNSWWPGATFTAFFGLGVASGVIGLYALVYSVLGVMAMYVIARPVWRWGKQFDLRTQSDLLALRYQSPATKAISSLISVVALFPWLVLSMQAMGVVVQWATNDKLTATESILIGVAIIAIRQVWTVQMGMRGLIITDMVQGIVAYLGSALLCVGLLLFTFHGFHPIRTLPSASLSLPGFGSAVGGWYYFSLVASGVIGSLCWPMIFARIYTGGGVREVKKGALQTMIISLVFYGLLMLVAMDASSLGYAAGSPQLAWFAVAKTTGGSWLLAMALLIVFAATMGFVDGLIQSMGAQVANDIIGTVRPLRDRQQIIIAKLAMTAFAIIGVIVAYQTYNWSNLVNLAQLSYQAIIQLSVPIFLGLAWRRGNRVAAIWGMLTGTALSIALTIPYFSQAGTIPWLGGFGAGLIGLAANLIVYLVCSLVLPPSKTEQGRVSELFARARTGIVPPEPDTPPLDDAVA